MSIHSPFFYHFSHLFLEAIPYSSFYLKFFYYIYNCIQGIWYMLLIWQVRKSNSLIFFFFLIIIVVVVTTHEIKIKSLSENSSLRKCFRFIKRFWLFCLVLALKCPNRPNSWDIINFYLFKEDYVVVLHFLM